VISQSQPRASTPPRTCGPRFALISQPITRDYLAHAAVALSVSRRQNSSITTTLGRSRSEPHSPVTHPDVRIGFRWRPVG
jgi:hypothetical protein